MNMLKKSLCAAALMAGLNAAAQNPYSEIEADGAEFAVEVKFSGQKPGITDFVSAWIGDEPEDELTGLLYEMWQSHLKNKPLDKNEKITVDAKNGYVCFEINTPDEGDGYGEGKTSVEMCYWNCSDGKHKVIAKSVSQYQNGKAFLSEFGGISFAIYNNDTHKIVFTNGSGLGADDIETGVEHLNYGSNGEGEFYVENSKTGERKKITEDEYNIWYENYPVITYALPRSGKNITATINNLPSGNKQVTLVWDGLRFELQK